MNTQQVPQKMQHDLSAHVSSSGLSRLRSLHKAGDTKALHDELKALGLSKMGERARAIGALAREEEAAVAGTALAPAVPMPHPPTSAAAPPPRVAFVCHTGYFTPGTYGGATRASLAMLRDARRICGLAADGGGVDVLALVQTPVSETLVYKLEGGTVGVAEWEGETILVGRAAALLAALKGRRYDVVISFSIEMALLSFAFELSATATYATPHNYYMPPFGPFRRFPVANGHLNLLQRLDALLSPCEHHCGYLQRWGPPRMVTRPLYAVDYRYFHEAKTTSTTSPPIDLSDGSKDYDVGTGSSCSSSFGGCNKEEEGEEEGVAKDGVRLTVQLPLAMSPWTAPHKYVTMVSPSPEKGLAIFATLARRLPHVPFAAVATQWTGRATLAKLRTLGTNVSILQAHPNVDVIFRQTKVLLAPSLWQECCPLVVMEACLRGVPCVSSDVFGLPEANFNPDLVVKTSLCYDHARGVLHHGTTNSELEMRYGNSPPPLPDPAQHAAAVTRATDEEATTEEVAPFEAALRRLLEDENYLREEGRRGREAFYAFAKRRQHGLRDELRSVAARRREDSTEVGGAAMGGTGPRMGTNSGWLDGASWVRARGVGVVTLTRAEAFSSRERRAASDDPSAESDATSEAGADDDAMASADGKLELMAQPTAYRVLHSPFIFVRTAPARDAEILSVLMTNTTFVVDARRCGWVRTANPVTPIPSGAGADGRPRRGWALIDGAEVGLGLLLEQVA